MQSPLSAPRLIGWLGRIHGAQLFVHDCAPLQLERSPMIERIHHDDLVPGVIRLDKLPKLLAVELIQPVADLVYKGSYHSGYLLRTRDTFFVFSVTQIWRFRSISASTKPPES